MRAGKFLAEEHPVDADIVIGVPDSGLDAALGYANASGILTALVLLKTDISAEALFNLLKGSAVTQ